MKQFKERLWVNIGHKPSGIGFDLEHQSRVIILTFDECNELGKNILFNNIFDKKLVKYIVDIMYFITFN